MAMEAKFLAFDLGAESGRAVTGFFEGEKLRLQDAHRFATGADAHTRHAVLGRATAVYGDQDGIAISRAVLWNRFHGHGH